MAWFYQTASRLLFYFTLSCLVVLLPWSLMAQEQEQLLEEEAAAKAPPAQARFAFSTPMPDIGVNYGKIDGRVGLVFPRLGLYLEYCGGAFVFGPNPYFLYGLGLSYQSQILTLGAKFTQTNLQQFIPYVVGDSYFRGGEGRVGLRLGSGAINLTAYFRTGMVQTLNYRDGDRLLLLANLFADALIEKDVFVEIRALVSFDWMRDAKDKSGKFGLRTSLPFRIMLSSDSALRWYLTPFFGYLRPTLSGASSGILTDFFYAPNAKIRADSVVGVSSELRLYPLQDIRVPILEDLFIAALGQISAYHLSPKPIIQMEEYYRFGGAVGMRLFRSFLAGLQLNYLPIDKWKFNIYLKGDM